MLLGTAQVCDPAGNLFLVSNYDGGIVTINVDEDIPNLVIGISTYEPVQVTITGPFATNVVQVLYAGMNSSQNNNNCGQGNFTTSIVGVNPGIITINPPMQPPQVGYTPAHGNGTGSWGGVVIGAAGGCDTTVNTGGVNTPDELVFHFEDQTGASLYAHYTQYGCWQNDVIDLSAGGNLLHRCHATRCARLRPQRQRADLLQLRWRHAHHQCGPGHPRPAHRHLHL
jgi:hypothetical protein